MNTKDWMTILIPAGISILGFVITFLKMRKEFENSIKQSINEDRKKVYQEMYRAMDKSVNDLYIVFDSAYIKELLELKAKAYIFSSEKVRDKFKTFCRFIYKKNEEYQSECLEKKPKEDLIGSDWDGQYELFKKDYENENCLNRKEMKAFLSEILKDIQNDLGIKD